MLPLLLTERQVKRREFLACLGGVALSWPRPTWAQQSDRLRRVGVLMGLAVDDPGSPVRVTAFVQALQQLGWAAGRNIEMEIRWGGGDAAHARGQARDLVAWAPDVILAATSSATAALLEATRTTPIVFVNVTDPVSAGYVASLARPGGNATGFMFVDYGMGGKWLELLKEIAPGIQRVAVIRDPALAVGIGQLAAIQSAAASFRVDVIPIDPREAKEMERALNEFVRLGDGGLIVTASPAALVHRELVVGLAARHRLPASYFLRSFVSAGGLFSYGPDPIDAYGRAGSYVDRILKGETPADLPVQAPTKYELVINSKTAKALGLTIPPTLLARADEVIE
jgi:putative tryptophan/tyrosine transport system substrate-binding protein